MPVTLEQGDASSLIRLDGTVDITSAAELNRILVEAQSFAKEVRLSLQSATALDVTAIQLLSAAEREASASGVGFVLEDELPERVLSTLVAVGFETFPVPAVAS